MGTSLSSTLNNVILVYFEKNRLQNCPSKYVADIFVLFTSPELLKPSEIL